MSNACATRSGAARSCIRHVPSEDKLLALAVGLLDVEDMHAQAPRPRRRRTRRHGETRRPARGVGNERREAAALATVMYRADTWGRLIDPGARGLGARRSRTWPAQVAGEVRRQDRRAGPRGCSTRVSGSSGPTGATRKGGADPWWRLSPPLAACPVSTRLEQRRRRRPPSWSWSDPAIASIGCWRARLPPCTENNPGGRWPNQSTHCSPQ